MEKQLTPVIKESFIQYAGAVLQSRALVDSRDCIKPSARQIFYSMWRNKYTSDKPFEKTNAAVGDAMKEFYIHGDGSCTGIIMRAGQPFAMRYPIIEVKGNMGTMIESGNWAAARYTSSRLGKMANYLFADIQKNTIDEWRDNYADNLQYPAVLPSKGFYNLVNGSQGISVGMSSSLPQFNICELNKALITLLWDENAPDEEILILPDFATGAILLNEEEVKQSLLVGTGRACKLRSVIDYEAKEKVLVVKEIPYGVYTNTICKELEEILNGDENPGIDRFNDLTGSHVNLKIYLTKNASPERVLKYLYKNTSLQSWYTINMTMLENGRYPRVFGWRELLLSHLAHEKEVYIRGFSYDLKKIRDRLYIIDGLIKAISMIDEVVKTIKKSADSKNANIALQRLLGISEIQAKAILDLKLSRLTHLDISKLENEKAELETEKSRIEAILADEILLKKEIEKGLREVAEKFGDARRTKIINISNEEETIERKQLALSFTNEGAVFVNETSTLYSQRRNGVGQKFKLDKGEFVVDTLVGETTDEILFFTDKGRFYSTKMGNFSIGEKQYLNTFVSFQSDEQVRASVILSKEQQASNIVFITKNGILKKSSLSEYNLKRGNGAQAIKLDKNDTIVSALILRDENIGVLSHSGNFIMISTSDIRAIGRVARGVVGIKLNEGDFVTSARVVSKEVKELLSISEDGSAKRTSIGEFGLTGRATKGKSIQQSDKLCDFLPLVDDKEVLVVSNVSQIRLKINEIPLLSRATMGVKVMKLKDKEKIQNLVGLNS